MSVILEILENLADYLGKQEEFADLDVYYSQSMMTANTEVPCISFKIKYADDNSEKKTINPSCSSIYRYIDIMLHTRNKNQGELEMELLDFDENIWKTLNEIYPNDLHPNLINIKYVGSLEPSALYFQMFRQNYKEEWFSNVITIRYELEYNI